jgi:RNA polymerase sigma factor (sigma-70 family)
MTNDIDLLRRYVEEASEAAFTELTRRHIDFVFGAALRQARNAHRAEDITQAVFTDLARKAATLLSRTELVGWLYISTHYAATAVVRSETRREAREREAQMIQEVSSDPIERIDWPSIDPVLDAALSELGETDRTALLLRFFKNHSFSEIGVVLRMSDEAARKRTDRALEKLRTAFARHGVTSTAAAIAVALANPVIVAAPAGLVATVASTALAGATAAGAASAGGLASIGAGIFMSKTTAIVSAVALAALVATYSQWIRAFRAESDAASLTTNRDDLRRQLDAEKQRSARSTSDIVALRNEIEALKAKKVTAPPPRTTAPAVADAPQQLTINDRITSNLKQIAAGVDQFTLENGRSPTSLDELVGEGKIIKRLVQVAGESYSETALQPRQTLVARLSDGQIVNYTPANNLSPAAMQAMMRSREIGKMIQIAQAAYGETHNGQRPPNDEALLPYFSTPQDAADYVEFIEKQKTMLDNIRFDVQQAKRAKQGK